MALAGRGALEPTDVSSDITANSLKGFQGEVARDEQIQKVESWEGWKEGLPAKGLFRLGCRERTESGLRMMGSAA